MERKPQIRLLRNFEWPKLDETDMAFPRLDVHPVLWEYASYHNFDTIQSRGHKVVEAYLAGNKSPALAFYNDPTIRSKDWKYDAIRYAMNIMESPNPRLDMVMAVAAIIFDEAGSGFFHLIKELDAQGT